MKNKFNSIAVSLVICYAMMSILANAQSNFSGPRNMGTTLNTANNETGPVISPNGLSLYFTSNRPGGQGSNDIYVSQRSTLGSDWGTPQNLGATVNSSLNDNITGMSLDGRSMLISSNRTDTLGGTDIYVSTRINANNDFGWTAPINLGATINSTFGEIGADFFENAATGVVSLIFSSDRVAMNGQNFLFYQSTRNPDGTFTAPLTIDELNGQGSHFGPAIRRDGLEIIFGSARPAGLNPPKVDIYLSNRASTATTWSPPSLIAGINNSEEDRLPKLSPDGSILYMHSDRAGGVGGFDLYFSTRCSIYSTSQCRVNRTVSDFNGDGQSDLGVFRPSDGTWWILQSGTNTLNVQQFGTTGDKIVPGDYDGDGRTDMAVFRPSDPSWWILRSSDNTFSVTQFGLANDKPVPADYDADGKTDIAVYRNGTWYINQSSQNGNISYRFLGLTGDIPVAGTNVQ